MDNLDQLSVIGEYSREKDGQHQLVKDIDGHYDALVKVIDQGHLNDYKNESYFLSSFGDPILKKDLSDGAQRWLYRHAIFRLAKDKVYVYFDHEGKMIRWEKLQCPSFF